MKSISTQIGKKKQAVRIILALLVIVSLILLIRPFLPINKERRQHCMAELEYERCYQLNINGKPAFYINELEAGAGMTSVSTNLDSIIWHKEKLKGCWINRFLFSPICGGRILTTNPDYSETERLKKANERIDTIISQNIILLDQECERLKRLTRRLNYYLDVHNVTDEGYNTIASLSADVLTTRQQRERVLDILKAIKPNEVVELKLVQHYTLLSTDKNGKTIRTECELLENEYDDDVATIQTKRHFMPDSARSIYYNSTTATFIAKVILHEKPVLPKILYRGETKDGKRSGHGILLSDDGSYYDGMWDDDQRNGFGFAVDTLGKVFVGEWKDDIYKGERLIYTSDRIYGIDISRYQHDIGKKHYGIDWSKMRITHLGTISNKRIQGAVDYPVSFCYIKATEGTTIKNRYYHNDYTQARQHGILCGTYHFFSTKSSATDQAKYFIQNAHFNKGDLPPVLDVEPYPSQVKAMGGTEVMLNKVRTFLRLIKEHTGVKPILYVSQSFVNRYLTDAVDIKREYKVWIARYGEYKPDIRLAIWQLSPDGRVAGIRGNVDINVFNGYQDEYQDFLETQLIK